MEKTGTRRIHLKTFDDWPVPGDRVCLGGSLLPDTVYRVLAVTAVNDTEALFEVEQAAPHGPSAVLGNMRTYLRARKSEIVILETPT